MVLSYRRVPPGTASWAFRHRAVYIRFVSAPFRKDKTVADRPRRPSAGQGPGSRGFRDPGEKSFDGIVASTNVNEKSAIAITRRIGELKIVTRHCRARATDCSGPSGLCRRNSSVPRAPRIGAWHRVKQAFGSCCDRGHNSRAVVVIGAGVGNPIAFDTRDERPHPFGKLRAGSEHTMLGWGIRGVSSFGSLMWKDRPSAHFGRVT